MVSYIFGILLFHVDWRGQVWYRGREVFWVLTKKSIAKPDPHRKYIIQRELLGTDMLSELMNSNYTRCHIELMNRSCGGWLVSTLLQALA